jgi:hypothetical protein
MRHLDCVATTGCKASIQTTMNPEPTEDLTTDDELEQTSNAQPPKSQIVRPEYTFKGQPLWPYTLGAQIVFNQAIESKDKMMFVWAAFVFLLLQRGEKDRRGRSQ